MSLLSSFQSFTVRTALTTLTLSTVVPSLAVGATDSKALREALVADYPLTRVGS
jgi:hypothetical protein